MNAPESSSDGQLRLVDVGPGDLAAGGNRQPHRELADQPEADHDDLAARPDVRETKPVERHGRDRPERPFVERDAIGQASRQIPRDSLHVGVPDPGSHHPIAGPEPRHRRPYLGHNPGRRIPNRHVLIEVGSARPDGRSDPVLTRPIDDGPHEVGPCPGLLQQRGPGELVRAALGSTGDEAGPNRNEQP